MSSNYLETLGDFYNQKMKFLTKKDKFVHCDQCQNAKMFQETDTELIFTCGSDKGQCGIQIKIELPLYIHYETQIKDLKEKIEKHLNWDILQEYIDSETEVSKQNEEQKLIKDALYYITDVFQEQNIKTKEQSLQRFYTNRIQKTKRCKVLKKQLLKTDLSDIDRQSIQKEYVSHVIDMNKEYQITKKLVEEMNPYIEKKPPIVTIQNTHYHKDAKKPPKQKETEQDNQQLIERIMDHFKNNEGILTKTDYNRKVKKPHKTLWGALLFNSLQKDKIQNPWLSKKQEKLGSIIQTPPPKPTQIQLTKEWMKHLQIFDGASDEDLNDPDTDTYEPEPAPVPSPVSMVDEQPGVILNPQITDLKEGYKIIWKPKGTDTTEEGYLDKVDKRLKTKVKIINQDGIKIKIYLTDLIQIMTL
jgi:hypothetical protein